MTNKKLMKAVSMYTIANIISYFGAFGAGNGIFTQQYTDVAFFGLVLLVGAAMFVYSLRYAAKNL